MTMLFIPLVLLTVAPSLEAGGTIEAMGSSSAGLVLIVTGEGGWEERLPSGKRVRSGTVNPGAGERFLERAAIAPDGTRWAAVVTDSTGAASVLAFDWGHASPTRRWPRVSRNVEQLRWWGDRIVVHTDGDGVLVLGTAPTPERRFPGAYGIAVAGDLLLVNEAAECWSPPKGDRFVCMRELPARVEVRSRKRAGAIEREVMLALQPGEVILQTELGADGTTFVVTTSNRVTQAIHPLVLTLASGSLDRRAEGEGPPTVSIERTYGLLTLVSSSPDSQPRRWVHQQNGSLSFLQLSPNRFLLGSGNRLSRLDTTTWNWEPLAAAAEEGNQIVNLALAPGGAVVVALANGVATLTKDRLSPLRPFGEFWAFSHITQDSRLVLAWQPSNTRYLVTSSGVR